MSARNRELFALIPAALLVTAGFAGVYIQRSNVLSNVSLTYGAIFLGLCVVGHIAIRMTLPHADPYMFPLVALLASFGIVMMYRISSTLARQQAQWFVVGLILFVVTIVVFRDYRRLERYRYTIVAVSLVLLLLPRVPGLGEQVMVLGARRVLGVTLPPIKHFGPVLVIWGVAMLALVLLSDIGSSLMFYGALLAMLYVATGRVSFVVIGLIAFVIGAWFLGTHIAHVHARFEDWQHPFDPHLYRAIGGSYQVANGIFAQAAGGLFGQGFGQSILSLIPFAYTDMIYSVVTNELGLFGASALIIAYLLFVYRGYKAATLSRDSFSTLLAAGLSTVFALQVFVIVGGVTRVIPLTGVTLPFISYGGASIVANFVLLALLLLVSDLARRPTAR
jgi:cell division protein FtsW (lipid II flippase)